MKRHIILTSNAYYPNLGGIENSLYYLAKAFKQNDFEVDIVVSNVNGMNDERLASFEVIDGINVHRYGATSTLPLLSEFSALIGLMRLLKKLKRPQTIGVVSRFHHTTWAAKLAGIGPVVYLVPGVVAQQDAPHNLHLANGVKWLKLILKQKTHSLSQWFAFKKADSTLVFSQNMLTQVATFSGLSARKIRIVKPGVDSSRFCPLSYASKQALRASLNISPDTTLVVGVGRLVKAKGFHYLIEAMRYRQATQLMIVGDGPQKAELSQLIAQYQLEERVSLIPSTPEPQRYYQAADVFVMASTYEPLGQTILEALSAGLPIVAFSQSLVPETATFELLGTEHAIYADSLDGQGLANAINEASKFKGRISTIENNRRLAEQRFNWQTLADELLVSLN